MEALFSRLGEMTVLIYAISVCLLCVDFLQPKPKIRQIGLWILAGVWVLLTIGLIASVVKTGHLPVFNVGESLYFFVWILVLFSLLANRFFKIDFLVFFMNIISFIILVFYVFSPKNILSGEHMREQLISELMVHHITFAIISYSCFAISFVLAVLYLFQYSQLKQKKWGPRLFRLGDLNKLEKLSYSFVVIGIPILMIALILGLRWAVIKIPDLIWYDWKIVGSITLLVVYSIYLFLKAAKKLYGKTLAIWNIICFVVVLINFFAVNQLSKFHLW